mgnify:CR=1 FL=1
MKGLNKMSKLYYGVKRKWDNDDVIDAFNQNLNLTLSELSRRSGWTVKEIKDLLMGDNQHV